LLSTLERPRELQSPDTWRKRPVLIRNAAPADRLAGFGLDKVMGIVARLAHMRVFVSDEGGAAPRTPAARLVPNDKAPAIFQQLAGSSLKYTVLLNKVETVDADVRAVRDAMQVPHRWREDDIVLTYSSVGSGIGYHAGHEDAIIVQAAGRRHWRVWPAEAVEDEDRKRILISARGDYSALERRGYEPLIDCELRAGDALYIPPFCPHQGVTLKDSISIALGWRGVAYFHLLGACSDLITHPDDAPVEALAAPFFELVPDAGPGGPDPAKAAASIVSRLKALGCAVADEGALSARLCGLYASRTSVAQNDAAP
jgi:ribosomal protein L16 Arg81 hydroxylase